MLFSDVAQGNTMKLKQGLILFNVALIALLLITFTECEEPNPNKNTYGERLLQESTISPAIKSEFSHVDSVYVPIYSNIYSRSKLTKFYLTATLSIRNTSYVDTLLINTIDYFNTKGEIIREYLENPILLNPMASIDYVIDEEDHTGGSGAHFTVIWSGKNRRVKPIIQAVMISTNGQQGVAFTAEGVSIKQGP